MSGQILTHTDLTADLERRCDVCIVGSGAGGAVLAAGLVEAGLDVVMLEEGSSLTRKDFTLHEGDAYPAMYQERSTRKTADQAMTVLQGRTVGGSTTVNWTTCFRTPERILSHWAREFGLDALSSSELSPHFEAVERRLNIETWKVPPNGNNSALQRGCEALGWDWQVLKRNVKGCANSGYCGVGCPVDGKQAMGITYLSDAVKGGLTLLANVRAEELEVNDDTIVAVRGRVISPSAGQPDGARVVIRAKVTVCSGGAINSPYLLLRSGLTAGGLVGRRTFLHPVVAMLGRYEERINPFWGAPQSVGSHQFIDRGPDKVGFFMEAAPLQPMLASVSFSVFGDRLLREMGSLPHISGLIALSVDGLHPSDQGGTVTVRSDGRPLLDYPVSPLLAEAFGAAHEVLAKVHLAAGARETASMHVNNVVLTSEADLPALAAAQYGAHEHSIFTAHQMGGCAMGTDPARSVVDPQHRFRGMKNLFVVDGSVLPTALGVNPSETVYGLAHRAVPFVIEAAS
jgi:choline dehydrogenase-like flavoprotein